jgi:hypothetical protein
VLVAYVGSHTMRVGESTPLLCGAATRNESPNLRIWQHHTLKIFACEIHWSVVVEEIKKYLASGVLKFSCFCMYPKIYELASAARNLGCFVTLAPPFYSWSHRLFQRS